MTMRSNPDSGMTDVFVERSLMEPFGRHYGCMPRDDKAGCLDLYNVEWLESLVGVEHGRLICHFRAPDAEAVRVALRHNGTEFDALWTGSTHGAEHAAGRMFIVEFNFAKPPSEDDAKMLRKLRHECLKSHQFKLNRAIISRDRTRAICICESLCEFVPYHSRVWPFIHVKRDYAANSGSSVRYGG